MIQSFHVQNFKALRDVTLELTPIHVLIGPNDSGKTSLLQAIAALCRSVDMPLHEAFTGAWTGQDLVWHGAPSSNVSIGATFAPPAPVMAFEFECQFGGKGRTVRLEQHSIRDQDGTTYALPIGNSHHTLSAWFVSGNLKTSDKYYSEAGDIHALLSGVHVYRWIPSHLALPVAPDAQRRFRMEPSGFGLALCLDDILSYDRDRFIALENRFTSLFPHVKSIKLLQEPAYKAPDNNVNQVLKLQPSDGKGLHFQFTSDSKLVPASQVSDGLLLVLAYLTLLYLPEPPRVLLIEEPENGIHPARLKQVLTILRELIRNQDHTQIVLSTHSPYVVSLFEPQEVTLCHKGEDGAVTTMRLADSKAVREQMDFFTLGEIWTGEGDEGLLEPVVQPAEAGAGA